MSYYELKIIQTISFGIQKYIYIMTMFSMYLRIY